MSSWFAPFSHWPVWQETEFATRPLRQVLPQTSATLSRGDDDQRTLIPAQLYSTLATTDTARFTMDDEWWE